MLLPEARPIGQLPGEERIRRDVLQLLGMLGGQVAHVEHEVHVLRLEGLEDLNHRGLGDAVIRVTVPSVCIPRFVVTPVITDHGETKGRDRVGQDPGYDTEHQRGRRQSSQRALGAP